MNNKAERLEYLADILEGDWDEVQELREIAEYITSLEKTISDIHKLTGLNQ